MKKGKLRSYAKVLGEGESCPKCKEKMERRKRVIPPRDKTYFFTEWDYCPRCSHVQHYEHFKAGVWQEEERQQSFLKDL